MQNSHSMFGFASQSSLYTTTFFRLHLNECGMACKTLCVLRNVGKLSGSLAKAKVDQSIKHILEIEKVTEVVPFKYQFH